MIAAICDHFVDSVLMAKWTMIPDPISARLKGHLVLKLLGPGEKERGIFPTSGGSLASRLAVGAQETA